MAVTLGPDCSNVTAKWWDVHALNFKRLPLIKHFEQNKEYVFQTYEVTGSLTWVDVNAAHEWQILRIHN